MKALNPKLIVTRKSFPSDQHYNADEIDCLDNESVIADIDIGMQYDGIISEMRIEITGAIPDAPFEIYVSTGNVSNIDVTGDGTDMITLTNAGDAKSTDFKDAQLIPFPLVQRMAVLTVTRQPYLFPPIIIFTSPIFSHRMAM